MLKLSNLRSYCIITGIALAFGVSACEKDDKPAPPADKCKGIAVGVTAQVTNVSSTTNNGSITASATGGSGFTFSLNDGSFQSSGTFNNLAAGSYKVIAKSSDGCTGIANFTVAPFDACAGKTITVTALTTSSDACVASGSITVTAIGSTGFTYSLNNGAFQSSNTFTGSAAGNYTITVKDAGGCTKTAQATVTTTGAGTFFSAVKALVVSRCTSCHSGTSPSGGKNFTVDCNIVSSAARIKVRAVDESTMPADGPLNDADKKKITDWINAGGKYTD